MQEVIEWKVEVVGVKVKSVKSGGRFKFIMSLRCSGEEESMSGLEGKSKWRSCCFAWTPASVREEPVTWKGDVRFREDFIVVSSVPATVLRVLLCVVVWLCLCECGHFKSFNIIITSLPVLLLVFL